MKKSLLILGICLATALWCSSAKAIGTGTGVSALNAVDHSIGSYHGFKVNFDTDNSHLSDHGNNYYTWKMYSVTGGVSTQLVNFDDFQFVSYIATGTDFAGKFGATPTPVGAAGVHSSQNLYGIGVQWLNVPVPGTVYAVEVEEYNGADATFCSARRLFYVSVTSGNLDFMLAARNAFNGAEIVAAVTQADLTTCNSFSGDLIENIGVTALGTTEIYYKIDMTTEAQSWNGQWGFDYTFSNTLSPAYEVKIVDAIGSVTEVGTASGSSILVNINNPTAYVKVIVTNELGTPATKNYTLKMIVTSETPFIRTVVDDALSAQTELAAQNTNNNQVLSYIINASPEVGAIGVD